MSVFSITTKISPIIPSLKSFIIGTVSTVALFGGAAQAQVSVIYRAGSWETIAGVASDGKGVCGIRVRGPDKALFIKWFAGSPHLVIHLMKLSWAIPHGTRVDMAIQFDAHSSWSGSAEGFDQTMVELTIGANAAVRFLEELRYATSMTVRFPSGSEGDWTASMAGSNAATLKMLECINWTTRPQRRPTQPFTSQAQPPATTQPYSSPVRRPSVPPVDAERPTAKETI